MADEIIDAPAMNQGMPDPGAGFGEVPIEVTISVGKAYPLVGELMAFEHNSVLTLDQKIDDPVELYVGNKLIARGELQELEGEDAGKLAVRLTEVAPFSDNS